jgi:hypothetical protein
MTAAEIRDVGESGPTIDKIELGEFESHAAMKEWLETKTPVFAQMPT